MMVSEPQQAGPYMPAQNPCWRVLFSGKSHSLLVPSHDRRAQYRSVDFFIANPLHRLWARALLAVDRVWPMLPELTRSTADRPAMFSELPLSSPQAAFQIGTPGPYQKASMLILGENHVPIALAKISLKPSADAMVVGEARWLSRFDRHSALLGQVPRLLTQGTASSGRHYLVSSVSPGRVGPAVFTATHAAFLRDLYEVGTHTQRFVGSSAHRYLADSLERLRAGMAAPMASLLTQGLDECVARLQSWRGPFVLAHGDFAPWNMRLHREDIFVFDWEYAEENAMALQDICHFLLLPQVLSRRAVDATHMNSVVEQASAIVRDLHPQFSWERPIVAALCLGYLLHTVLFYSISRGAVPQGDAVVDAYCRLIEERSQWID